MTYMRTEIKLKTYVHTSLYHDEALQKSKKNLHLFKHVKVIGISWSHESEMIILSKLPSYSDDNENISELIWDLSCDVQRHSDWWFS